MQWNVYEIGPIDLRWERLKTVDQIKAELTAERSSGEAELHTLDLSTFERAWQTAQHAAHDAGWDGDFRIEPVVFWVPAESEFGFGFVIKQSNNGITYVVSPVDLPHLTR